MATHDGMDRPRSPKKSEVYEKQLLNRSASMDPVWQAATSQMAKMKCARVLRVRRYRIEQCMTLLSLVSVFATILVMQFEIVSSTHVVDVSSLRFDTVVLVFRTIVSATTLFLIGLILFRADTVCKLRIVTFRLPPHTKYYHPSAGLLMKILFEVALVSVHVPPGWNHPFMDTRFMSASILNTTTGLQSCPDESHRLAGSFCYKDLPWPSSQLDVVVFVRLYMLFRWLRHRLGFESVDIEWLGTEWHVQTQSLAFTVKYMFRKHPVRFAAVAFATTWMFTSVLVEFIEHAINVDLDSTVEALWLLVLTMSTAGLGSIPPKSFQGQVVVAMGGIVGGAIISALITSVLIQSLRVTDAEAAVVDILVARHVQTDHQVAAIHVLERFGQYVVLLTRHATTRTALRHAKTHLFWSTVTFQASRHALAHLNQSAMHVLDRKTAAVKFRTTALLSAPTAAHTAASMDALERKMHAVHSTLLVNAMAHRPGHSHRHPKGG
ncbi:hypothetical protein, variant 1 [Aphanomyces astaci]|uniref:Potassium channel domain-containing protein n=1 Tax=Aphanomyces astaci TaxID=112090 RepID=W4GQ90_APHAT|nr:hypothetical protein, variant 1 [Aphanomyces astaci]ETV81491.1 hypothetical protein, variant 1 [Aphanomyces astaci]|eukprot:XP_009829349.1 hypothetical protein, variant 1 [Aphanomyces astaci]